MCGIYPMDTLNIPCGVNSFKGRCPCTAPLVHIIAWNITWFQRVDTLHSRRIKILWLHKKPIGGAIVYERGGLSLPNLQWYYWAAQLSAATCWFSANTPLSWVNLKRTNTSLLPVNLYVYSAKKKNKKIKNCTHNLFVKKIIIIQFRYGMRCINIKLKHWHYPNSLPYGVTAYSHLVRMLWASKYGLIKV